MQRVAWVLALAMPCDAFFAPLAQDQMGPYLRLWDGRAVNWNTGEIAALIETSSAVRISYRGIHFYDHEVFPKSTGYACRRTPFALCELAHDGNAVLPSAPLIPRYSTGADQAEPVRFAAMEGCGEASVDRMVDDSPLVYDISACDLANIDIVWSNGRVYVDPDTRLPLWAYAASSIGVLFLVISLGQNISRVLGDPDATTQPWITEIVCVVQCLLLIIINDPWRVWVAEHDRLMLCVTIAYVVLYISRHSVALLVMEPHVYTLNVITATLMLVTSRLYCTFETPYSTIFLLLLLTRLAHKLFAKSAVTSIEKLTITADALYVGLHYRLAYHPGFFDPQMSAVYLGAIAASALAAGAISHAIEERAKAPPQPQYMQARVGATILTDNAHTIAFRAHRGDPGSNLRFQIHHR
jgi:hypothetical protein